MNMISKAKRRHFNTSVLNWNSTRTESQSAAIRAQMKRKMGPHPTENKKKTSGRSMIFGRFPLHLMVLLTLTDKAFLVLVIWLIWDCSPASSMPWFYNWFRKKELCYWMPASILFLTHVDGIESALKSFFWKDERWSQWMLLESLDSWLLICFKVWFIPNSSNLHKAFWNFASQY